MKSFIIIAVGAVLCISSLAEPRKVDIHVDSIQLKNGKKFTNADIKSYDHQTGNVVIMANRSITSIQLELLPDELAERIVSLVPAEAKSLARDDRLARESEARITKTKADAERKRQEAQLKAERERRSGEAQVNLAAQRERQTLSRVMAVAERRAARYFKYEFNLGTSVYVFKTDLDFEEPEPVTGWPDRYRVKGKAGISYYVSKGSSLNSLARDFEVTVQANPKGVLEAVDVTCR
jgi:hypothetical protein